MGFFTIAPASSRPLASFAFIPETSEHRLSRTGQGILVMSKDGQFKEVNIEEACKMSWRPTGDFVMTGDHGLLNCTSSDLEANRSRVGLRRSLEALSLEDRR